MNLNKGLVNVIKGDEPLVFITLFVYLFSDFIDGSVLKWMRDISTV